jgi:hypothetical protein
LAVVSIERSVTLEKAIQGTPIRNLVRELGDTTLLVALSGMILHTAGFFNLGRTMNDDQAIDTASMLIDQYPFETIEDFTLMFREAKKGKYGEMFNRLDGQIIFRWMGLYLEEKAKFREKMHEKLKFGNQDNTDLMQVVIGQEAKMIVSSESAKTYTVVDALKKAIDFDQLEKNEMDYDTYKKNYLKKIQTKD